MDQTVASEVADKRFTVRLTSRDTKTLQLIQARTQIKTLSDIFRYAINELAHQLNCLPDEKQRPGLVGE